MMGGMVNFRHGGDRCSWGGEMTLVALDGGVSPPSPPYWVTLENNENPYQTTAKTSSSSPYLEITILLYKYVHPYLPTYHKKFLCKLFFGKSMAGHHAVKLKLGHFRRVI